ncbi:glycosyltransferase [Cupriavidus basilensis]
MAACFARAKANWKFFEAGLLGIPTVASATDTFVRVIENGINGFIPDTADAWHSALSELIESRDRRVEIGARARETALERFAIQKCGAPCCSNL